MLCYRLIVIDMEGICRQTQDVTEEIRGLFDTQVGHFADKSARWLFRILFRRPETEREGLIQLIQLHTKDTEVRNIIMTGAEALIEQGIERGAREMSIHNIFTVLSERFSQAEVEPVRDALETVSDLTRLTELFRTALHISSVEAFLQMIDALDV